MTRQIFILIVIASCACTAAQSSSAATIPAGTTLMVQTDSLISSKEAVGRTFAAKIAQDVAVKGKVLLKAGTEAFGRVQVSRAKTYKSEPLSLELTSISVNGVKSESRRIASNQKAGQRRRDRHGMDIPPGRWWLTREARCSSSSPNQSTYN